MVDDQRVRHEASNIAADAVKTRDLSDVESECLNDLLRSDEAFALLVTAQQNAVLVNAGDHDIDQDTEQLAVGAAQAAGDAIDRIVEGRIEDAREIAALADRGPDVLTWSWALQLYQGDFETLETIREVDQATIIAETEMSPASVAKLKADLGGQKGVEN